MILFQRQVGNGEGGAVGQGIDVEYVARLARLELEADETRVLQGQLEQVVGYVRKISELDLREVAPMSHAVAVRNVFREDEERPGLTHEEAMRNAPAAADGQFEVPTIVE